MKWFMNYSTFVRLLYLKHETKLVLVQQLVPYVFVKEALSLPIGVVFDLIWAELQLHSLFPQYWYRSWMEAWKTSTWDCYFVIFFFSTFSESKADKLLHQSLLSSSRRHTQKICEQNEIWHVNRRQTVVEKVPDN